MGRRILEALGGRDLPWLSAQTGVKLSTLYDYVRDGITRADAAHAIARALDVSLDWLIAGVGEGAVGFEKDEDLIRIPLQDVRLAAGAGADVLDSPSHQADLLFPRQWLTRSFGRIDGLRLVRISGDSMETELGDGDWAMIDINRRELRDGIHAVRLDDTLLVKRVQVQGRQVRLVSANPVYSPIVVDLEDEGERFGIVGRVVWSARTHVHG
jgi:hypothetical protein